MRISVKERHCQRWMIATTALTTAASCMGSASAFLPTATTTTTPRCRTVGLSLLPASMTAHRPPLSTCLFETKSDSEETTTTTTTTTTVMEDANEALASVGWAPPTSSDAELTSDDPFVKQIDLDIQKTMGVGLDELLNPAKVVNLERDLYNLRMELATTTGVTVDPLQQGGAALTTEECDGGGGGKEAELLRKSITKKEADLTIERRSVFRGWLKNVFLAQAILSFCLSWVMATNPESLFGGFSWYYDYQMDMPIRVLGFWWWWLFVVPSLRSRRPKGTEKKALDLAFLGTPLVSLLAPVATKDTAVIWAANFAVVVASYAFAFAVDDEDSDDEQDERNQPEWLKFIYKSLDFGTGRERGARK